MDPEFLFRVETDPQGIDPDTPYRLSDLELASRVSFFLWSSIPDEELLGIAERGELRSPGVLEKQVRRLLADSRSESLVTNFASQWLYLRNMRAVAPDLIQYPEWGDNLADAMQRETELFLSSQFREDRSVIELLTADYTYLNERLARHYGIPNVYGSSFRRVELEDDRRSGLLGHGSILTITSYSTRTSPVRRGKWLMENILGSPPPPPPPNVPGLPEADDKEAPTTVRERMIQHRADPVCASCHVKMDPLGFSLEQFDGIGKWRDSGEDGLPVDSTAIFPDGTTFHGPAGLRALLMEQSDEFVRAATEKMLTYALGRGIEYYDQPVVRDILRESEMDNFSWSSIILGIVNSTPFQMRRSST